MKQEPAPNPPRKSNTLKHFYIIIVTISPAIIFLWQGTSSVSAANYGTTQQTAVTTANTYVDATLSNDCVNGNYSKRTRNCSGNDGKAYRTVNSAVNNTPTGQTIAIRQGSYNIERITLSSKTLTAYNDEAVTLEGCVKLEGTCAKLQDVKLRNSNGVSSCGEFRSAVGIAGTSRNSQVAYNHIEPGNSGAHAIHIAPRASGATVLGNDLNSTSNAQGLMRVDSADGTDINGNRFTGNVETSFDDDSIHFGQNAAAPDMTPGAVARIRNNHFQSIYHEAFIDYKGTTGPQTVELTGNFFNGYGKRGRGYPCVLWWAHHSGYTVTSNIRSNIFVGCSADQQNGKAIAIGTHSGCEKRNNICTHFTGVIEHNIFSCNDKVALIYDAHVQHAGTVQFNIFDKCSIKSFGGAKQIVFQSNVWDNGSWKGSSNLSGTCRNNNLRNVSGNPGMSCTAATDVNPGFIDSSKYDYKVTHNSIIGTAHNGGTRGADMALIGPHLSPLSGGGDTGTSCTMQDSTRPIFQGYAVAYNVHYSKGYKSTRTNWIPLTDTCSGQSATDAAGATWCKGNATTIP